MKTDKNSFSSFSRIGFTSPSVSEIAALSSKVLEQLTMVHDTTQQNISQHVISIYNDRELEDEATYKKFLLVRQEGSRKVNRNIDHYNLDMIIALGYREREMRMLESDFDKAIKGLLDNKK